MIKRILSLLKGLLGREIDMKDFEDRLLLQKLVYPLQNIGINSDYYFSWYVRGPYSCVLANEAFDFSRSGDKLETLTPNPKENKASDIMKGLFSDELDSPHMMELYASLMFFVVNDQVDITDTETLHSKMRLLKPWFTEEEVNIGIEKISKLMALKSA